MLKYLKEGIYKSKKKKKKNHSDINLVYDMNEVFLAWMRPQI